MIKRVLLFLLATAVCCQLTSAQDFSSNQPFIRSSTTKVLKGEVPPVFPGGEAALSKYLKVQYPCEGYCCSSYDRNPKIEVVINANGAAGTVKVVLSSACPRLDSIAKYHVASMPDWTPATKGGTAVPYTLQLEIDFNRFVDQVNVSTGYVYPFKNGVAPTNSFEQPIEEEEDDNTTIVDRMPEFKGGMSAIMDFVVRMPYEHTTKSGELKVDIMFVIDTDGSVTEVSVKKTSGDNDFDKAAVDYVKTMPKWKPGFQDGKPVRVEYVLPLRSVWH